MQKTTRLLPPLAILVLGWSLSLGLFDVLKDYEVEEKKTIFRRQAEERIVAIEVRIAAEIADFSALAGIFPLLPPGDRNDFNFLVDVIRKNDSKKTFRSISWVPRVSDEERERFEHNARVGAFSNFRIVEAESDQRMVPAARRAEYFPILYTTSTNERALGFDYASIPIRKAALEKARDSGDIAATAPIPSSLRDRDDMNVRLIAPIYRGGRTPETLEGRRADIEGVIAATLVVQSVVEESLQEEGAVRFSPAGIDIYFYEGSGQGQVLFYTHSSRTRKEQADLLDPAAARRSVFYEKAIPVADRQWHVVARPVNPANVLSSSVQTRLIALLTALLAVLLAIYLHALRAREGRVRDLVEERTRQLSQVAKRAEDANRAKSAFLANMSHELRTPLNAVIGFSQVLGLKIFGALNEKQSDYIGQIEQAGERLLDLVNNLFDLSFLEAGEMVLKDEPVDIGALLKGVADARAAAMGKARAAIRWRLPEKPLRFTGDTKRLKQAFGHLIANALKFTPETGEIAVSVALDSDGAISIAIADTGPGMSAEEILAAHATIGQGNPFTTGAGKGAGLGLPLARRLVELHGGTVAITSILGRGTTVTVRLPPERIIKEAPSP